MLQKRKKGLQDGGGGDKVSSEQLVLQCKTRACSFHQNEHSVATSSPQGQMLNVSCSWSIMGEEMMETMARRKPSGLPLAMSACANLTLFLEFLRWGKEWIRPPDKFDSRIVKLERTRCVDGDL